MTLDDGTTLIRDIGQINPLSKFSAAPTGDFGLQPDRVIVGGPIQVFGTNSETPLGEIELERANTLAPVWRVLAKSVPSDSTETLLLAALPFGKPKGFDGKIQTVDFDGSLEYTSHNTNATAKVHGSVIVKHE